MIDSIPLVVFTGQVATSVIGTDAFQEADIMGITTPITKHNYQVRDIRDIPRIVKEAFHIANTGRKGEFNRFSEKYFYRCYSQRVICQKT